LRDGHFFLVLHAMLGIRQGASAAAALPYCAARGGGHLQHPGGHRAPSSCSTKIMNALLRSDRAATGYIGGPAFTAPATFCREPVARLLRNSRPQRRPNGWFLGVCRRRAGSQLGGAAAAAALSPRRRGDFNLYCAQLMWT